MFNKEAVTREVVKVVATKPFSKSVALREVEKKIITNKREYEYLLFTDVQTDDSLNCAESWKAFGNYQELGIPKDAEAYIAYAAREYRDWVGVVKVDPNDKDYIYIPCIRKAYEITTRGSSSSHSEDNTTPSVETFGNEVSLEKVRDVFTSEYMNYVKNERSVVKGTIDKVVKDFEEELRKEKISNAKSRLKSLQVDLEVLNREHPRARKQRKIFEEWISNTEKTINDYESGKFPVWFTIRD